MVWMHSYLEVLSTDLPHAKTFSTVTKPCLNLLGGWCNVPGKQLPGKTEMMIATFHHGTVVYAYKSPINPKLGATEQGAKLTAGWSKVVDRCTQHTGVRPGIFSGGHNVIDGLAFDKVTPTKDHNNCDTVHGNYEDCRWRDCQLPKSISSLKQHTQMTLAIFVR